VAGAGIVFLHHFAPTGNLPVGYSFPPMLQKIATVPEVMII
jgi:thiamine transporter ThiT